ncbi:proline-rich nuclear receptor coactivator 1 [Salmo salar]|uniref:Proline-rich nuclear receptor coactivator 1 n=1 Tax=Salmo salar TaxID=8030 RepID=A0A1S3M9L0_SALSA|nr:proline-rich nuclear receptor coactivator 1 [Salmo salar]|eukprot:XP_013999661.1 PREDICTED: proline-rich nuclear receptor coactivator 1-like [Salmo salar]
MLGESLINIEPNLDNFENNKPPVLTSYHVGASLGKTRQALLKKGGRKLRSTTSGLQRTHQQPRQKTQRNNPTRLADINNNVAASKSPTAELATHRTQATVLTCHHLKQRTKKELLKSKNGRVERATTQGDQSVHNLDRLDQAAQNLNTRSQRSRHVNAPCNAPSVQKYDNSCHTKPNSALFQLLRREEKNPFNSVDNVKIVTVSPAELVPEDELKDGEKIYAGAKFSEPPSPSVLPKPPSHWVGETAPQHPDHSREQITFHLKSLLKVQDKP